MPYIPKVDRPVFDALVDQLPRFKSPGELNYLVTCILIKYVEDKGGVSYTNCSEALGQLGCIHAEYYRRVLVEYEQKKCVENGDVRGF